MKPPDSLLTQLDVYVEEKYEDEEDMRERVQAAARQALRGTSSGNTQAEAVLEDIITLARQHGELYPIMVETLRRYGTLLQRDMEQLVHANVSW